MIAGAAHSFLDRASVALSQLFTHQAEAFGTSAAAMTEAVQKGHLIYLFGTGHSHILAEEGLYRAGGLACVVPILDPLLMLHLGAVASSQRERQTNVAQRIMSRYPIGVGDVLVIFSNSGVNTVPLEAARYGRSAGACVIAVTSEAYSRQAAGGGERLSTLAEITIDNGTPPGDACFQAVLGAPAVGPLSTIMGAAILNALLAETVLRLSLLGIEAPIFVSANIPGAAKRNATLVEYYSARNPHL